MSEELVKRHRQKVEEITGACSCIDAFKNRKLVDPACVFHECGLEVAELLDRIEALEERLEINHAYQVVDGKMQRVAADMSDCDGIMARDETIKLQKQELANQRDIIDRFRKALDAIAATPLPNTSGSDGTLQSIARAALEPQK